ncbi:hypothetical protein F5X99DRAFT_414769 [Biscogniauxia marginata]|nr:hypothetical protein F5X99DRAFT_414769 [Biscogniauxia marginata]
MSGRAPGGNSRGRGGKFKKFTRGGGKHFSRNLRPLDADGNEISMWSEDAPKNEDGEADSSEEESDEDESDEDSDAGPSNQPQTELSREERRQAKKAQKEAAIAKKKKGAVQVGDMPTESEEESEDDDMPANPNHSKAARNMTKAQPDVEAVTEGVKKVAMSRKERESMEAQQAKERYRKLHEAGKTDEAKADLARLALIREKREAEAARKNAEREEREAYENARKTEIETKEAKKREAALGKGKKGKSK